MSFFFQSWKYYFLKYHNYKNNYHNITQRACSIFTTYIMNILNIQSLVTLIVYMWPLGSAFSISMTFLLISSIISFLFFSPAIWLEVYLYYIWIAVISMHCFTIVKVLFLNWVMYRFSCINTYLMILTHLMTCMLN